MSETLVDTLDRLERGDKVRVAADGDEWKLPFYVITVSTRDGRRTVSLSDGGGRTQSNVTHVMQHLGGETIEMFIIRNGGTGEPETRGRVTRLDYCGKASLQKRLRMAEPEELGLTPHQDVATDGGRR